MPTTITRIMNDGVTLAGSSYGPKDGQPVLLFHGGGQTRHAWGKAGQTLGDAGYHAITFDARGHGDSTWAPHYATEDFVDDVYEIAIGMPKPPIIVGASLGGFSALLANARETGEISKALVMVDIALRMKPEGIERILNFMSAHADGFDNLEDAAEAVAAYQPHRKQRSDPNGLQKNLRQHEDGRWYWHWDPVVLETFKEDHRKNMSSDELLYEAAESLTQPILLVRGMISDVVDDEVAKDFKARIPHAEIAEVGGAGHMVAGDKNDIFLEAVMGFLRRLNSEHPYSSAQAN